MPRNKLKNDTFRKNRGGRAKILKLSCEKCGEFLFEYQKDGPGILKRLYLDRIRKELKQKNLTCPNCKQLLGIATIYKKENRPAYRLFAGALVKSR
jgi:ribosomal protein S27AE